jgi:hypothetical protein
MRGKIALYPGLAIGGIDSNNIKDVLEAGAQRVAVSLAIMEAQAHRGGDTTIIRPIKVGKGVVGCREMGEWDGGMGNGEWGNGEMGNGMGNGEWEMGEFRTDTPKP